MLVVTAVWIANFYTAYMATLAAGLVSAAAAVPLPTSRAAAGLAAAGRAGLTVALGMGLAAPLVTVVYFGTTHASAGRFREFAPVATEDLLARAAADDLQLRLAGRSTWAPRRCCSPSPCPSTGRFPAACAPGGRCWWLGMTLSMQWAPTQLLWHAFAAPQGSSYRQTFVLCALLVIAAWYSLSYGPPDRRALGAAGALLALIAAVASRSDLVRPFAWPVLLLAAAGALVGLALLGRAKAAAARPGRRTAPAVIAVVLLLGAQLGEATATSAVATRMRFGHMDDYAPWGDRQQQQAEAIARADGWPRYRTDPGREQTVGNDPMVVGGQGAQYYSSHTSDVLSRTLTALGGGWTSRGRSLQSLDNAVTDVIFSVGARVHSPPDPHQNWFPQDGSRVTVSRQAVPPLVTVRPPRRQHPLAGFGPSPYRNQELLLGTRVYTVPRLTVRTAAGKPPTAAATSGRACASVRTRSRDRRKKPTITAQCPAGSEVYLWAPHFAGTARLTGASADGPTGRFRSDPLTKIAAMERLGTVPVSGSLRIELAPEPYERCPGRCGRLPGHRPAAHRRRSGSRPPAPPR